MQPGEVVVRIRFWENQEDCRDEYYAVPERVLAAIRSGIRGGEHPSARAIVERDGRKLEPVATVEVVEY
jgi:hypothetical protein